MAPWLQTSIFGLTLIFMLVGLFGLVIPIFPGMLIMWLSALGYGLVAGFGTLGVIMFVLITLATIAGMLVDNVLMGAGARRGGASWLAIALGMIAGVVGTFLVPPIGGLIAAPLAILLVEYLRSRNLNQAWSATRGLAVGWGLSFLARFGIGVLMIVFWLVWALNK